MNFYCKPSHTLASIVFLFLLIFSNESSIAQQLAFPSALGSGAYTTGGRGGVVVHVTNLRDNGPGSLREAMQLSVPRIIVFDVSGVIKLKSILGLSSKNSNFTIAGQTAPEGGITIDGARIYFSSVDNFIIRHIRFKGGKDEKHPVPTGNDSFTATSGITNQIYDHVTFAFGVDEAADWQAQASSAVKNVTIQRSFFAESTKGTIIGRQFKKGSPVGETSFIYNLFFNTGYRTPNIIGDGMNYDVINNVAVNSGGRLINSFGKSNLNHIGNYYDFGNYPITDQNLNLHRFGTIPSIYTKGNKITGKDPQGKRLTNTISEMNTNNKLSWKFHLDLGGFAYGEQLPSNYFTDTQFPLKGKTFSPLPADLTHSNVINDVGCNARLNADGSVSENFDQLDKKWLNEVHSGIYPEKMKESKYKVPPMKSVFRPTDFYQANPHIPEVWFAANVPSGQDHNDIAPSGYTWLEEYLNQVDGPSVIIAAQSVEVKPAKSDLQVSKTLQLTKEFKLTTAKDKNGTWTSSDEDIAKIDANGLVTAFSVGKVTMTFTATDGGYKGKSEITVFREALQASAGKDQEICKGESATLTASGGTSYLWSTGAKTEKITVSPNTTKTYTVTAYDSKGKNSTTDEVTVHVNPIPVVDAGSNITIQPGESTTLKAKGALNYKWSTGATGSSIIVSPSSTTTYTVTGDNNGCETTTTVKVTVLNSEAVVADAGGERNLCAGSSTTLTAKGGSTYLWSTGEKTEKITVSPKTTTIYTVTAYDSTGKNHDKAEVKIVVKKAPVVDAGGNITIQSGEKTTLKAKGASNYIWNTGAKGSNITVSPRSTTTYTVTGEKDGCEATDAVTVTVLNSEKVVADAGGERNIYAGSSTTLTAKGGATYLWSTGERTSKITVSPTVTTIYTVIAYDRSGKNSDKATVKIVVKPVPVVDAGRNATINSGESITLRATGADDYKWSTGGKGSSITVSPNKTTTYKVTGDTDGFVATDTVKVKVLNSVKVVADAGGERNLCVGSSTTLTAKGGSTYLWSTGAKTAKITVSPSVTTIYTVTAYDSTGENSDDASVKIMVKPVPVVDAGSNVTINEGQSTTLQASGASNYEWDNGALSRNITVSPITTTTYSVTGFRKGCEATATVKVTVINQVKAKTSSKVDVSKLKGTTAKPNVLDGTYVLNKADTSIASSKSSKEKSMNAEVVVNDGLSATTPAVHYAKSNTNSSIDFESKTQPQDEAKKIQFLIYPNPTFGNVNINISDVKPHSTIHLYDSFGLLLYSDKIVGDQHVYKKNLNLSGYPSGIYFLKLVDNERVITKKIILK